MSERKKEERTPINMDKSYPHILYIWFIAELIDWLASMAKVAARFKLPIINYVNK